MSTTYYDHRSHQLLPRFPIYGSSTAPQADSLAEISTQPDLLASAKLKIEAADSHIKDLAVQINAFFQTDPRPFRSYVDIEDAKQVFKVELVRNLSGPIYTRIGDALSNTRSSLDHLAGALAVKNGHTAGSVNFPVTPDQKKFEEKGVQRIEQKLGKDAWAMICALKPYRGGNDLLWSLNALRNMDTHETVVPIASGVSWADFNVMLDFAEPGLVETAGPARFDENNVARIWRIPASATILDGQTRFSLDVAFTKVEPVDGQPVIAVLQQFLDFTRRTVSLFEKRFFT
jgi:hypothetical protein